MRPAHPVRVAAVDDLDGLTALCLEARAELQVGSALCTDDPQRLRDQIAVLLGMPDERVLVALVDDVLAGLLVARNVGPGPFTDATVLNLEALYVGSSARRRGVGHALMVGAAGLAEESGATEIYASPLPGARGMYRYLARIGFAPAASHRVMSTAALQRRLAQDAGAADPSGRAVRGRTLEGLIARRRRARDADAGSPVAAVDGFGQARASISMQVSRAVQTRLSSSSTTTIS